MPEKATTAVIALLCLYGFFKDMRPAVPFLTPFLRSSLKNFTAEEVDNQIYPVLSYSWMGCLLFVLVLADFVRYKPVLVVGGACYVATSALWLWGKRLEVMQLGQVVYGLATATETVYFSYIYVVVEEGYYKKATGYVRSATLFGQFLASTSAQIVVSLDKPGYLILNYITLGSVSLALLVSVFLPLSKKSLLSGREKCTSNKTGKTSRVNSGFLDSHEYDTRSSVNYETQGQGYQNPSLFEGDLAKRQVFEDVVNCERVHENDITTEDPKIDEKLAANIRDTEEETQYACAEGSDRNENAPPTSDNGLSRLFKDLKTCYGNQKIVVWSVWWALATCGNNLEVTNVQNLWYDIEPASVNGGLYNGVAEAVTTLAGALVSFSVGYMKLNWSVFGEVTLGVMSLVEAILLVVMATTNNIWVCYGCGVLFKTSYYMLITVASFQVAHLLSVGRYALVFGCNNLLALALQAAMVAVIVDKNTLNTGIRTQFLIYGGYFYLLAAVFLFKAVYTLTVNGWRNSWTMRWTV